MFFPKADALSENDFSVCSKCTGDGFQTPSLLSDCPEQMSFFFLFLFGRQKLGLDSSFK